MKATWILANGRAVTLDVPEGQSLMEAARGAMLPGIAGECGGTMSCATCHVELAADWAGAAGSPCAHEDAMLDMTTTERGPHARLSCQLCMAPALDGIVLHIPR